MHGKGEVRHHAEFAHLLAAGDVAKGVEEVLLVRTPLSPAEIAPGSCQQPFQ